MSDRADGDTAATAALPPTGNERRDTIPPDAPVLRLPPCSAATGKW
jgi:hypothetical protein